MVRALPALLVLTALVSGGCTRAGFSARDGDGGTRPDTSAQEGGSGDGTGFVTTGFWNGGIVVFALGTGVNQTPGTDPEGMRRVEVDPQGRILLLGWASYSADNLADPFVARICP